MLMADPSSSSSPHQRRRTRATHVSPPRPRMSPGPPAPMMTPLLKGVMLYPRNSRRFLRSLLFTLRRPSYFFFFAPASPAASRSPTSSPFLAGAGFFLTTGAAAGAAPAAGAAVGQKPLSFGKHFSGSVTSFSCLASMCLKSTASVEEMMNVARHTAHLCAALSFSAFAFAAARSSGVLDLSLRFFSRAAFALATFEPLPMAAGPAGSPCFLCAAQQR
mmetsp:Transcript_16290/g.65823  ORF Transcript_16290/g.65823 Transcript_16290/m.65823 type:complete len:218 (-) Transcript_16290:73-726(-)